MTDLKLWYRHPAARWTEALPVGNGRLGAMIFGGARRELIQLNESTLWAGGPYSPVNPEALPNLAKVRELIFAGRYAEAEEEANRHLMAKPLSQMSYQPAGNLVLEMAGDGEVSDYRRELDLDRAVATTTFQIGGVRHTREIFASAASDIIAIRHRADRKGAVSLAISLDSPQAGEAWGEDDDTLNFVGRNPAEHGVEGALSFAIKAQVIRAGGARLGDGGTIHIDAADEVTILLDVATSFRRFNDLTGDPQAAVAERLSIAAAAGFDSLLEAHVAAHRRAFHRMSLDLGRSSHADLPTDQRIARDDAVSDPQLAVLYLQYGRYLMLGSSRPGGQPANLQGIWNDLRSPPWGSKYTANINLQMNYWLPDPANLGACVEPLFAMVEDLAITGAVTARDQYGAGGWVLHHNTDLWRATAPIDGAKWGLWPTGGAWLCVQLWDHLAFHWNDGLADRLYPVTRGALEFILEVLQPFPGTDYLVTNPSLSPENPHPFGAAICAGPTMDNQIIRDLLTVFIEMSERRNVDADLRARARRTLDRLVPNRIGKAGQLQEWIEDWDMEVPEINHRHVSHLYGLYPSHQIDFDTTPELTTAARRSLEIRGDDATGWGIGWRLNLWARLRDGDHAHSVLAMLLGPERTYPNMFDAHPPFQIDGNFGGAAGIIEMLVQSKAGEVLLLPALPSAWPAGKVTGVQARGDIGVDLEWRASTLVRAEIKSAREQVVRLCYGAQSVSVTLTTGKTAAVNLHDGRLVCIPDSA